jgi:plastocyanin
VAARDLPADDARDGRRRWRDGLVSAGFAFDKKELDVPADEPFTIFHVNQDGPGTPHDVEIRTPDGTSLQPVPPTNGGESMAYDYEPLAAGEYIFICSIHPIEAMTGTLTVQ